MPVKLQRYFTSVLEDLQDTFYPYLAKQPRSSNEKTLQARNRNVILQVNFRARGKLSLTSPETKSSWESHQLSPTNCSLDDSWIALRRGKNLSMRPFPDFHHSSGRKTFLNHLPLTEANRSCKCPACFRITSSHSAQEHHTSTSHSSQRWGKAPQPCWVIAASDAAQNLTTSGKGSNGCRSTVWKSAYFLRSPTRLLVFKHGGALFPLPEISLTDKRYWSQSMLFHLVSICPFP